MAITAFYTTITNWGLDALSVMRTVLDYDNATKTIGETWTGRGIVTVVLTDPAHVYPTVSVVCTQDEISGHLVSVGGYVGCKTGTDPA